MSNTTSVERLKRAIQISEQIDSLQAELNQLLAGIGGGPSTSPAVQALKASAQKKGGMSAAGRRRIAEAQRARWAKQKSTASADAEPRSTPAKRRKRRGKLSAEGRARIVAALKRRWAKAKNK
jgi:hypothetical protein